MKNHINTNSLTDAELLSMIIGGKNSLSKGGISGTVILQGYRKWLKRDRNGLGFDCYCGVCN